MIIRIVIAFLVFMIVMGAIQKWLNPNHKTPLDRLRSTKLPRPRKCRSCGRFLLGGDDCRCKGR
ncbi:MAG: hypothetical protein JJU09_05445 [Rhodobacteraceae bacterium]|nr:hypothetical protein [Paracoccaceae bacterium]TVR48078.1 MAG: hypothetical protein EA386_05710 [Paracoccaceae bacterium]